MYRLTILLFTIFLLSCQKDKNKVNYSLTELNNKIYVNENDLFHFIEGEVIYGREGILRSYFIKADSLFVEKIGEKIYDTLLIKNKTDNNIVFSYPSGEEHTLTLLNNSINDSIRFISFESFPCFGTCAVQKLELRKDTLHWEGHYNLDKYGQLKIPAKNIETIINQINQRVEFIITDDFYVENAHTEDNPYYLLKYKEGGIVKEMKIEYESDKQVMFLVDFLLETYKIL
jgi:hypothetical protein